LIPLVAGTVTALALRYGLRDALFGHTPTWWYVGSLYFVAAGIIFVVAVAVSQLGPYGATCRRDLQMIANRFLPVRGP
jgi:uncharacterized membrane protein YeiH